MFIKDNQFEYLACKRSVGNIREETLIRARQLYQQSNGKVMLGVSSGLDSQTMILGFKEQGLDIEYAFMHLPGYNDNEYKQIKLIEERFDIRCRIVKLDPIELEQEIKDLADKLDVHCVAALHTKFLAQLPEDYLFVQHLHDHFILCKTTPYFIDGYYTPANARLRAWKSLGRSGGEASFCGTSEYLRSMIGDDIHISAIVAHNYYDKNGLSGKGLYLQTRDRWDFYIKPIMFAKYWGKELEYFPKFAGSENVDYLGCNPKFLEKVIATPYFDFVDQLLNKNQRLTIGDLPEEVVIILDAYKKRIQ